jgi:hypothetical protein
MHKLVLLQCKLYGLRKLKVLTMLKLTITSALAALLVRHGCSALTVLTVGLIARELYLVSAATHHIKVLHNEAQAGIPWCGCMRIITSLQ